MDNMDFNSLMHVLKILHDDYSAYLFVENLAESNFFR